MKRQSKFAIPPSWKLMLTDMGIEPQAALTYAQLPADLFNGQDTWLTPVQYFQLWRGIEQAGNGREVPLLLAENFRAETFDAPIFASLCSPNFNVAAQRLSHYKPLIGPMILTVEVEDKLTRLTIECFGNDAPLPRSLAAAELVFFTQLIRLATREQVIPTHIQLAEMPENLAAYQRYFGCDLSLGIQTQISFSATDANRPFLTANDSMWEFFEDHLSKRLAELDSQANTSDRVRAVLLEALPSGEASIESVASRLAMSKRTLQRKLTEEAQSFQSLLVSVRGGLADHYLERSHLSLGEISFLLGFQESTSFIRAYRTWKGISPGQYRQQLN